MTSDAGRIFLGCGYFGLCFECCGLAESSCNGGAADGAPAATFCRHADSSALEPAASLACAACGSFANSGPPEKSCTHLHAAAKRQETAAADGAGRRQSDGGLKGT